MRHTESSTKVVTIRTVRTDNLDANKALVSEVQKAQNRLLKVLERKRISDIELVRKMLENQTMLLVNQMAAQIKLTEVWKAKNEVKLSS